MHHQLPRVGRRLGVDHNHQPRLLHQAVFERVRDHQLEQRARAFRLELGVPDREANQQVDQFGLPLLYANLRARAIGERNVAQRGGWARPTVRFRESHAQHRVPRLHIHLCRVREGAANPLRQGARQCRGHDLRGARSLCGNDPAAPLVARQAGRHTDLATLAFAQQIVDLDAHVELALDGGGKLLERVRCVDRHIGV